jgi:K+ transporter
MTATTGRIPPVLLNIVRRFRTLHRTVLLTTVTTEEVPHVVGERTEIEPLGNGLYRVLLRYGFMDEPHVHEALSRALHEIDPGASAATLTTCWGRSVSYPGRPAVWARWPSESMPRWLETRPTRLTSSICRLRRSSKWDRASICKMDCLECHSARDFSSGFRFSWVR